MSATFRTLGAPVLALAACFSACSTGDQRVPMEGLPDSPGQNTGDLPVYGACEEEGALRECAEKVREGRGILSCMRGMQECRGGVWGPCGHDKVTFVTRQFLAAPAIEGGGPSVSTLSSPDPGQCTADPCNPECLAFDAKPVSPISSPVVPGASYEGNPNEWGNAPGGFIDKQNCGDHGNGCWSGYPKDCGGSPTHHNRFDGCQADHHCDQDTSKCIRTPPGWTWPMSICPGVDLTIGPACDNGTNIGFPLCNRGNTELPMGTQIRVALRNGNSFDFSCPRITNGTTCNVRTSAPLGPGECMRVVRGPSCNWSGNVVAYVNSDKAIDECGISQPIASATQPGCGNNWSDVTTGAVCQVYTEYQFEPSIITEEYKAVCPTGSPSWGVLVYEAMTPCSPGACDGTNASSVQFEMQTAPLSNPTAWTPWTTVAHAPSPPFTHPSACRSDGPSPCPVPLSSILPAPQHEHLRLRVTLLPSPDGQAGSSLSNWQITYSCGAKE